MLHEFPEFLKTVKQILEHNQSIADNGDVDSIDLSEFDVEPADLISEAYNNSGEVTAPLIVGLREAHDFIVSHRRLSYEFGNGREHYYTQASKDCDRLLEQMDFMDALIRRYVRQGDR